MTIALLALLVAVQATPSALPTDPQQIARFEWAEFSSGTIDQSHFTQPIPQKTIDDLHKALSSLGAIKTVTLLKEDATSAGPSYVFRIGCEKGAVLEQFAIKDGKITSIRFMPFS
jgi:hypothetical protein